VKADLSLTESNDVLGSNKVPSVGLGKRKVPGGRGQRRGEGGVLSGKGESQGEKLESYFLLTKAHAERKGFHVEGLGERKRTTSSGAGGSYLLNLKGEKKGLNSDRTGGRKEASEKGDKGLALNKTRRVEIRKTVTSSHRVAGRFLL